MNKKKMKDVIDRLEGIAERMLDVNERLAELTERTRTVKERIAELERKYPAPMFGGRGPYEPPHKWWGEPGVPSFPGPTIPGIPSFPDRPCTPDHPCKPGIPCHYLDMRGFFPETKVCKKCGKM